MAEVWIELHATLPDHPKVYRLATLLGVDPDLAWAKLARLWLKAVTYALDGDLGRFTDAEVSRFGNWTGEPRVFMKALRASGWIDEDGHLHDWERYTERYAHTVEKREIDKARKRRERAEHLKKIQSVRASAGRPRTRSDMSAPTGPDLTGPDRRSKDLAPASGAAPTQSLPAETVPTSAAAAAQAAPDLASSAVPPPGSASPPLPEDPAGDVAIPAGKRGPQPKSWIAEAVEDWDARFGGSASHGKFGRLLKPLLVRLAQQRGLDLQSAWDAAVRTAWRRYIAEEDPTYANPARFVEKFGEWSRVSPERIPPPSPAPVELSPLPPDLAALVAEASHAVPTDAGREAVRAWLLAAEQRIPAAIWALWLKPCSYLATAAGRHFVAAPNVRFVAAIEESRERWGIPAELVFIPATHLPAGVR